MDKFGLVQHYRGHGFETIFPVDSLGSTTAYIYIYIYAYLLHIANRDMLAKRMTLGYVTVLHGRGE